MSKEEHVAAILTICSVALWLLGVTLFAFRAFEAAGWSFILGGVCLIAPVRLALEHTHE